jgi:uncharacterized membrane protein YfcA
MTTLPLSLGLGFGIGALLGMLGGGGSILTVPALVYLIGQTPQMAVTTSLAIVGANSAIGAYFHNKHGSLNWRVALIFGGVGMVLAYAAAGISKGLSPDVLMVAFALLMLVIGIVMLTRRQTEREIDAPLSLRKVIISGAGVGLLTGLLGVGGGFLIVPALVMLVGLPIQQAVATSLVVIAMNSAAGFLGHLDAFSIDLTLISVFVGAGIAGTFAGARVARRLPAHLLRQTFALFVITLALFLLYDNLPKLL